MPLTGSNESKHVTGDTICSLGGAYALSGGSGFDYIYGAGGADNKLTGDGATLIFNRHGLLQGIKLTLTDNYFGDNDPASMRISGPGALTFQEEEMPGPY